MHSDRCVPAKLSLFLFAIVFCVLPSVFPAQAAVTSYQKDFPIEVKDGNNTIPVNQKRWYLENEKVRFAVTDDPGGAVVEFVNKETGTNHVAGEVYSYTVNGATKKNIYYGWKDVIADSKNDPLEKQMQYQPYRVEFVEQADGAKSIKVTGQTAEQKIERWHTLQPASAEVAIRIRLTNISSKARRLWIRWHPFSFASSDVYGDSACVLSPGKDAAVRKIRVGWGFDNWFRTYDGYWAVADFKSGEGFFTTFEKDKVPVHFTWTDYKPRSPLKGSVTLETLPEPEIKAPGEAIETRFTYFAFSKATPPEAISLGLVSTPEEQARARTFLRNIKPVENLGLLNRYTFTNSEQFSWSHRRRDILGLRDWGFADCAVIGFPLPTVPMKVRMVGGVFPEAAKMKGFPAQPALSFRISATDERGQVIYSSSQRFELSLELPGQNYFDRQVAIPMAGIPDGRYTLRVEAYDLLGGKPFHEHQMQVVVFADKMQRASEVLADELGKATVASLSTTAVKPTAATVKSTASRRVTPPAATPVPRARPFVAALAAIKDVKVINGRATIPIGVEEGSGVPRRGFPVQLGVPFPKGAFAPNTPVRLLSPDGKAVPAEFTTMGVWPDKSLHWLRVAFAADCPANGFAFYKLEIGKGVPLAKPLANLAGETANVIEINSGPMLIRINRQTLSLPGEVFIDSNGDGVFAPGERVLQPSQSKDVWWTDADNRKYTLQLGGPADGDVVPGVVLESNGTQSAVAKITGWYQDESGKRVAIGEVRVEVARGQKHFKLWHQVTFAGSPWHDQIGSYGLKLRAKPQTYRSASYALDGQAAPAADKSTLLQTTANTAGISGSQARVGRRSDGALKLEGGSTPVLFYHRDFWQMYPKKIEADASAGEITIHYWPQEAGVHSFAPEEEFWISSSASAEAAGTGASRTQEMVLDFSGTPVEKAVDTYGEPVIACTPPSWVFTTKALQNLHPFDPAQNAELEKHIASVTSFFERNRDFYEWYGQWTYGTLHNMYRPPLYGWLEVGRFANIGNEECIAQAPWLHYFRSGDRKYYNFARVWTRHLMELQTIRWHDTFPEYTGMSRRHQREPWMSAGDWGHSMVDPFIEYYHASGYTPAWEAAKRMAAAQANTYSSSWRYISNPLSGNIRLYEETGEAKYKDTADRIWRELMAPDKNQWWVGSHGSRMASWYAPYNEEVMKAWKEWSVEGLSVDAKRGQPFPYLDTYGMLGDMTGDVRFAHTARVAFDNLPLSYTGQTHGVNPVYRGMIPSITQHLMVGLRTAPYAAGQIAKSRALFPARFYNGYASEILIKEDTDGDFTIWRSAASEKNISLTGPDGKAANIQIEKIHEKAKDSDTPAYGLFKITVKADGQKGIYRMSGGPIVYLGCSLKQVAIRASNSLSFVSGDDLYVRSKDLGSGAARILMQNSPGTSLEVFRENGKRLFSQTYMRPAEDAVAIEETFALPENEVLRLGDKLNIVFPDLKQIPLYLNRDGVFDLP